MVRCFVMISLSAAALICDVKTDRIPNELVAVGAAAGILLQTGTAMGLAVQGTSGLDYYIEFGKGILRGVVSWSIAALPVLFIGICFHVFRLIGGGDAKLLAVLAGMMGVGKVLPFLAAVMVMGGICSVCIMAKFHIFRERMRNLSRFAAMAALGLPGGHYMEKGAAVNPADGRFHFSIPVLLGVVWTVVRETGIGGRGI